MIANENEVARNNAEMQTNGSDVQGNRRTDTVGFSDKLRYSTDANAPVGRQGEQSASDMQSKRNIETNELISLLMTEIEKGITGKRDKIELLLMAFAAGGHVLIEDVPGVGKTTLAASLARAAGLSFRRCSFTPDVMASDITGFSLYNRAKESFEFREGLVMTNILLADEINRAAPKTQSSLLEAMEEGKVTVDGDTYRLPDPFFVIATQNPSGFVGTYPLPEAQLDRFIIRMSIGYPSEADESAILTSRLHRDGIDNIRSVGSPKALYTLRQASKGIYVHESLCRYMVALCAATRTHPSLSLGASPRASLALLRMAQAKALFSRRRFVVPEDIASILVPTLSHRLIPAKNAGNISLEDVLSDILRQTPIPKRNGASV